MKKDNQSELKTKSKAVLLYYSSKESFRVQRTCIIYWSRFTIRGFGMIPPIWTASCMHCFLLPSQDSDVYFQYTISAPLRSLSFISMTLQLEIQIWYHHEDLLSKMLRTTIPPYKKYGDYCQPKSQVKAKARPGWLYIHTQIINHFCVQK